MRSIHSVSAQTKCDHRDTLTTRSYMAIWLGQSGRAEATGGSEDRRRKWRCGTRWRSRGGCNE